MAATSAPLVGKEGASFADAQTLSHAAIGFGAGFVGLNPGLVVALFAVWDAFEMATQGRATKLIRRESPLNHLGDVLAGLGGAYAGAYYYARRPGRPTPLEGAYARR